MDTTPPKNIDIDRYLWAVTTPRSSLEQAQQNDPSDPPTINTPAERTHLDALRDDPDILVRDRAGLEFPTHAERVTWTNGVHTVLPWHKVNDAAYVWCQFISSVLSLNYN
jgi:hypothetical protein